MISRCAAQRAASMRSKASISAASSTSTPSNAHAFVVAQQMRRGVAAHALARGASIASRNATVEPLPLVPPTVMTTGAGRGAPMRCQTSRTRSRPSSMLRGMDALLVVEPVVE